MATQPDNNRSADCRYSADLIRTLLMENLHPDILDNLQEYDLEDILDALLKLHDPFLIADMVQTRAYKAI
ncbi:MAG: hypothetical protein AAFW75_30615 [Cyanobacteria bacterium J06636_16]